MATKNYYVSREQRHPLYSNKMLTTGVAIPLSDSAAKLYRDLGVKDLSEEAQKSRSQQAAETARNEMAPPPSAGVAAQPDEAPKPAAKKAPAKKAVRRKKS